MSSNDELFVKIDKVLEKAPENRHSYYQLKYFVLGKEPTTQSQIWQALRELQVRRDNIDALKLQIEDTEDEIELLKIDYENLTSKDQNGRKTPIRIRRLKRKQESLLRNIDKMKKKLEFEVQEARFFLQAFEALEQIEPMKDYDDHQAQQEYWEAKLHEEIELRILTKQPLPSDLLKTALSLHSDSGVRAQVIKLLENCKTQIQIACEKENDVR
ncbi:MAG: hypothetical protein GTO02_13080 [Candidatus Dadabacteria bacterium]|nr:hypothetical protein [Candidatus Dadabacteria bacterium]